MVSWFKKIAQEQTKELWTFSLEAKVQVSENTTDVDAQAYLNNFVKKINTLNPNIKFEIQFSTLKI